MCELKCGLVVGEGYGLCDILVTTDDDCILDRDYLAHVYKTFKSSESEIGFIGGKILPYWLGNSHPEWLERVFRQPSKVNGNKPNWFKLFFEGPLGILDYGNERFIVDNDALKHGTRLFFGANMAFQKNLFEKFGDYRLDKTITQDTEICLRLLRAGVKGLYVPEMKVKHKIKTNKITPQYYYRWYFLRGQYLEDDEKYQRKFYHPFGIQFSLIGKTTNLYLQSIAESSVDKKIHYRCQSVFNLGRMMRIAKENII
jgi:GT2 family glycosyltransferase